MAMPQPLLFRGSPNPCLLPVDPPLSFTVLGQPSLYLRCRRGLATQLLAWVDLTPSLVSAVANRSLEMRAGIGLSSPNAKAGTF